MINKQLLINLIKDMPCKHFTLEQRNELSVLLRAKVKKKKIANILGKDRTTVWRERKRAETNGRYYVRKAKRLAKEKRIKANSRFKKIEHDKSLRRYVVKKLEVLVAGADSREMEQTA